MSDSLVINALRPGQEINIKKVQAFKLFDTTYLIGLTEEGGVYALGRCRATDVDLIDGWNSNDAIRRAWCKLTGHTMSEVRAEQKKRRVELVKRKRASDEKWMRALAAKLGFTVKRAKSRASAK